MDAEGAPWPLDPRGALEAQVAAAADAGLEVTAGFEMEFFVGLDEDEPVPAHRGPAYSPHALLQIDELVGDLLRDIDSNGLTIGQLHAEYGLAQVELSLAPNDPVGAADDQLLARQTIHAAARANGLRASFAPLITSAGVGQGWHLHTSVARDGRNLLAGGPAGEGASWIAGLLRELPAITAVTTPSVPSQIRLRPGYFAGAYAFWGVENREAALRYIPGGALLGADAANIELKACDASANPYLALTAVIAAGLAGIAGRPRAPRPDRRGPGRLVGGRARRPRASGRCPTDLAAQEAALLAAGPVAERARAPSASAPSWPPGAATPPGRPTATSTRSSRRTCGATDRAAGGPAAVRRALRRVLGRRRAARVGLRGHAGAGGARRRERPVAAGRPVLAAARARTGRAPGRRAAGRRARRERRRTASRGRSRSSRAGG